MHRLLTELSPERLAGLYAALPEQVRRALDVPIARALNSRPASVGKRPEALRVKALRSYLVRTRDDEVAGDLLRAYLLGPRADLVKGFLDATGVAHEDGQVEGDAEPAPDKVGPAVEALLGTHEREDVHLYLQVARVQWPDNQGVADALQRLTTPA